MLYIYIYTYDIRNRVAILSLHCISHMSMYLFRIPR